MTEEIKEIKDPEGLLKAYNKAKEDIVSLRAELKALEKEKSDLEEAAKEFSPENLDKMKQRALKAELKAKLESDGVRNADRILKYLDFEGVDFDDNDNIVGADDKLKAIKSDFPELFDVKRRAGSNSADIHGGDPVHKELTDTEVQVAKIFGQKV